MTRRWYARPCRIRDPDRLPSGGSDHRSHRQPEPALDLRDQHRGHLDRPRRRASERDHRRGGRRVFGQGLRTERSVAVPRGPSPARAYAVRRQQELCGSDRAGIRGHMVGERVRRPMRQPLRRGRSQFQSPCPRRHPRRDRGRRPVLRSDGTPVRDYIYAEDTARAYVLLAGRCGPIPRSAALLSTFPSRRR